MEPQFTSEQNNGGYTYYTAPQDPVNLVPDPENRRYGLGQAIAATVLSFVSVIFTVMALFFATFGLAGIAPELHDAGVLMLVSGIVFTVIGTALAIVSLVMGIKSILCFKKREPRPVATLVLGIASTATAAESIFVAICDVFITVLIYFMMLFV